MFSTDSRLESNKDNLTLDKAGAWKRERSYLAGIVDTRREPCASGGNWDVVAGRAGRNRGHKAGSLAPAVSKEDALRHYISASFSNSHSWFTMAAFSRAISSLNLDCAVLSPGTRRISLRVYLSKLR